MLKSFTFYTTLSGLFLAAQLFAQPSTQNNTLRGRVLYQSSGNKPAVGAQVKEKDCNGDYSKDNGEYRLVFQTKRNGAALEIEIGPDTREGKKIELVNEKEIKAAKLPASMEEVLDIIVCPAGQRDIAAQRYYRILRTTTDRELEEKKKEVEGLLAQKDKDYEKISDLFAQLDGMQAALDSAKIREQAFTIASINLDRASQMVKEAVRKLEEEQDVKGCLLILNTKKLDDAYKEAAEKKKKAEAEIKQVINGFELKISLLESQFQYGEIVECYQRIIGIYEAEHYDSLELANYMEKAGSSEMSNYNYDKALEWYIKTLSIRKEKLGELNIWTAYAFNDIAEAYTGIGNLEVALENYQHAYEIIKDIPESSSGDIAIMYNNIGMNYLYRGNYLKANEYLQKAHSTWEASQDSNQAYLGLVYSNLSMSYDRLGNYDSSLFYSVKSIAIRETLLAPLDPALATTYNNAAVSYRLLGDYSTALTYHWKCLHILESILQTKNPKLALYYFSLALTYQAAGEYTKSLEYNQKALEIREFVLPPKHPDLAESYKGMSISLAYLMEYEKALEYSQKALVISETVLDSMHPELASAYKNIAVSYMHLHDYAKALEYIKKTIAIQTVVLDSLHPELAHSYMVIASVYKDLHDYVKALEYEQKVVVAYKTTLGESHPKLAGAYNNIAVTYQKMNEYPKAIEYCQKAISIYEDKYNRHPDLGSFYYNTATTYRLMGNDEKALEFHQKELANKEFSAGDLHPDLLPILSDIGSLFIKNRQFDKAKEIYERYLKIKADSQAYCNWVVYYALLNKKAQALECLQKAVSLGFNDLKWLETEPDLKNIRKEKGFKDLVQQLKKQ